MHVPPTKIRARFTTFERLMALGGLLIFFYWAGSVVMTVLMGALLAYFLDTIVVFLERLRLHRAVAAMLVLLAATGLLAGLTYLIVIRADQFLVSWPVYSARLQRITTPIESKLVFLRNEVEQVTSTPNEPNPAVRVTETPQIATTLLQGAGSVFSFVFFAAFLPFLIFFMLTTKQRIWRATMGLFEETEHAHVRKALEEVSTMLRRYVAGTALIGLILVIASWILFRIVGVDYAFLVATASGLLNLIPYLGALLALIPPFFVGMVKWTTLTPYLVVTVVLISLHVIAMNALIPAIVGRQVHLNGLAVTVALFFWGWLWGAVGLVLAIPITAVIKVICDHVEGWQPAGRWLGG